MIESWTVGRNKLEIFHFQGGASVPCGPTLNAADIHNDSHLAAREMIVTLEHPLRGHFMMPSCRNKLSDSSAKPPIMPTLGR